jgi:hypothetical protein
VTGFQASLQKSSLTILEGSANCRRSANFCPFLAAPDTANEMHPRTSLTAVCIATRPTEVQKHLDAAAFAGTFEHPQ